MGWHLTWQDPVAIALVVVCLAGAWWLRRRLGRKVGCGACKAASPAPPASHPEATTTVSLEQLRIGRREQRERR